MLKEQRPPQENPGEEQSHKPEQERELQKEDPFQLLEQLVRLDKEKEGLSRKEKLHNLKQRWLLRNKILDNAGSISNLDERARLKRGMVRWSLELGEETRELTQSLPRQLLEKIKG